jgi:hypothetical protein
MQQKKVSWDEGVCRGRPAICHGKCQVKTAPPAAPLLTAMRAMA